MKIINLVIYTLTLFHIKSYLNDRCLSYESFAANYKTDLSDCHGKIADKTITDEDKKGIGSFGFVIKCTIKTDEETEINLAIKVVKLEHDKNLTWKTRDINNELITLDNINRLKTVWLPLYYGCIYDELKGTVYIFMEGLDKTLENILEENRSKKNTESNASSIKPNLKKVLETTLQETKGIEQLHAIGLLHADIHTWNFMLEQKSDVLKLIDFGFVCVYNNDIYLEAVDTKKLIKNFDLSSQESKASGFQICENKSDIGLLPDIYDRLYKRMLTNKFTEGSSFISNIETAGIKLSNLIFPLSTSPSIEKIIQILENLLEEKTIDAIVNTIVKSDGSKINENLDKVLKVIPKEQKEADKPFSKEPSGQYFLESHANELKAKIFELKDDTSDNKHYSVESLEELKENLSKIDESKKNGNISDFLTIEDPKYVEHNDEGSSGQVPGAMLNRKTNSDNSLHSKIMLI